MSTESPKPTPDEFFKAFAIAILVWQSVEDALFRLFYALAQTETVNIAAALYYSQESFGGKLRLVDSLMKVSKRQDIKGLWTGIAKPLGEAKADRNLLAHMPAVPRFNLDGSEELVFRSTGIRTG
jgi:hypothetical protein